METKLQIILIRKAQLADLDRLLEITGACANHMQEQGIFQWNEFYPSFEAFKTDVNRQELYVYELEGTVQGCVVLSSFKDAEYETVEWLTPESKHLYIHRLAVHPKVQGHGLARELMTFAEQWAIDNNYDSIRLDTFSKNLRNQNFYELRGYKRLGEIYFPKQSEFPFYCYERLL